MRTNRSRFKNPLLALSGCIVLTISGCASDLVVTDVWHESWLASQRAIKAKVKNEGGEPAATSKTRVEVKPVGATTFTRQATATTPALLPGQEVEVLLGGLFPGEYPSNSTPAGQCLELRACADVDSNVTEDSETNNCLTKSFC